MYAFGAYWFWMPPIRSRPRDRQPGTLQQKLPREQRPVQLRENAFSF